MGMPKTKLTRRRFIGGSASLAASSLVSPSLRADAAPQTTEWRSNWDRSPDRIWLGPEYWANPLQDWRIANGRIECTNAALDRNVHVLTRQLADRSGTLDMRVRVGSLGNGLAATAGSVGFRIGAQGPLLEYRNSLISGRGLEAGISGDGSMFVGDVRSARYRDK